MRRRRSKWLALMSVALTLVLASCDTDQVQDTDATGEENIGATWADLPANLNCIEAGQNGSLVIQVRNVTTNGAWENMDDNQGADGEILTYNCSGQMSETARWEGNVWGLAPDSIYAYRLFGYDSVVQRETGSPWWTEDADPNNGGDKGAYNRFTTYSEYQDVLLADVGDEGGTDAQASVNGHRAHLVLGFRKGKDDQTPKAYARAWVKEPQVQNGMIPWSTEAACSVSMRTWSDANQWFVLNTERQGFFQCPIKGHHLRVEGHPSEFATGAAARVRFHLEPKYKRWRNLRSNCHRFEDAGGYDVLDCSAFLGPNPPPIGPPPLP